MPPDTRASREINAGLIDCQMDVYAHLFQRVGGLLDTCFAKIDLIEEGREVMMIWPPTVAQTCNGHTHEDRQVRV